MFNRNHLHKITLYPHRSLNRTGFFILMFFLTLFSFFAGIMFVSIGAWPVFGFFGLDILLIYVFFKINFNSGKKKEIIILKKNELLIKTYNSRILKKIYKFDPNWIKINLTKLKNKTSTLQISSKNKSIIIGSFLVHQEKINIVKSLSTALKKNNFIYTKVDVTN